MAGAEPGRSSQGDEGRWQELDALFAKKGSEWSAGDADLVIKWVLKEHAKAMLTIARCKLRNWEDAKDFCQEFLLVAWRRVLRNYDPERAPNRKPDGLLWAAFYRQLTRVAANVSRRRQREHTSPDDPQKDHLNNAPSREQDPLDLVSLAENGPIVAKAVEELLDEERKAIRLCYFEGRSGREIAKTMGRTENAVVQLLHRARKRLKKILLPNLKDTSRQNQPLPEDQPPIGPQTREEGRP